MQRICAFQIHQRRANKRFQPTLDSAAEAQRLQTMRLRFQWVKSPPWELSVHPGSYNRLMGG